MAGAPVKLLSLAERQVGESGRRKRDGWMEGGREGGRKGGREGGRERERERGREGGREK